ncbi:MAG: NAD-dependent epimerase/dehydratase family protein [Chlamydiales bacterium]|nr:NAD-dependent epimerase/dehydratase family protein [Chlamydiales bacterium]
MGKYLVTGGCGFIGSHLANFLLKQGCGVTILDNLSTGKKEKAPEAADLLIGSITDKALLKHALKDIDGVFHLAAVPSVQKSLDHWHAVHEVNSGGTVLLYETLAELPKKIPLIYASSSAVYGDSLDLPACEESQVAPLSPYGIDKLAGERHAGVLWNVYRIPSLSLRFFNVFGPGQDPYSPYSGVISIFAKRISKNAPLTLYGDGEQLRDFIYVEDVVRTMAEAISSPFEGAGVYNLCTGEGTTINNLADLMGEIAGKSLIKEHAPPRKGEIRVSIGDPSKAQRTLGFKRRFSLYEGLKETMRSACV